MFSLSAQRYIWNHIYYRMTWKWNEWGIRPPLCTYRLNWARRTSWGWWDEWDDTALQTQNSKFEPWRSEVEHATSRSRKFPIILNLYEWAGKNHFLCLKLEGQSGVWTRNLRLSKQTASTTAPGPPPTYTMANDCGGIYSIRNHFLWNFSSAI